MSPPGQIVLTVTSIPTISLSWSVATNGPVDSWEVIWREVDANETDSTSGTNYTIINLKTTTLYSVRVRGVNALGTADSSRIIFFTCDCSSMTPTCPVTALVILGAGAAMLMLILSASVIVNVVIFKKRNKAHLSTCDKTRHV